MSSSALRKLKNIRPLSKDHTVIIQDLQNQSDRGAAIVAAACVEDGLRELLTTYFVSLSSEESDLLFEDRGVLYTFDAKIAIGRAIGAYGKVTINNLNQIKHVRNTFAHIGIPLDFKSSEILNACRNIRVDAPDLLSSANKKVNELYKTEEGKARYVFGCLYLTTYFLQLKQRTYFLNEKIDEAFLKKHEAMIPADLQETVLHTLRSPASLP